MEEATAVKAAEEEDEDEEEEEDEEADDEEGWEGEEVLSVPFLLPLLPTERREDDDEGLTATGAGDPIET